MSRCAATPLPPLAPLPPLPCRITFHERARGESKTRTRVCRSSHQSTRADRPTSRPPSPLPYTRHIPETRARACGFCTWGGGGVRGHRLLPPRRLGCAALALVTTNLVRVAWRGVTASQSAAAAAAATAAAAAAAATAAGAAAITRMVPPHAAERAALVAARGALLSRRACIRLRLDEGEQWRLGDKDRYRGDYEGTHECVCV